ncbi:MAG TPA: hypothetical protein VLR46_02915 [Candidatus Dormibacteraeota bacterium]|nr:hypothetical protein [Candidatus Dormibacteraeota bacterium]
MMEKNPANKRPVSKELEAEVTDPTRFDLMWTVIADLWNRRPVTDVGGDGGNDSGDHDVSSFELGDSG